MMNYSQILAKMTYYIFIKRFQFDKMMIVRKERICEVGI